MKRLRQFFYDLVNTWYNPSYYAELHKRTFFDGFMNHLFFGILFALLVVIGFIGFMFSLGNYDELRAYLLDRYPDALVLTYKDGVLSKNIEGPVIIPKGDFLKEEDSLPNLVVIDTELASIPDDAYQHDAFFVITNDTIISRDGNDVRVLPLEARENTTFDEATLTMLVDDFKPVFNALLVAIPILILAFVTLFTIGQYLILSLLGSLAVLAMSHVKKLDYRFEQAYIVSMYIMLPIMVYDFLTDLFKVQGYFLAGAVLFLILLRANFRNHEKRPS